MSSSHRQRQPAVRRSARLSSVRFERGRRRSTHAPGADLAVIGRLGTDQTPVATFPSTPGLRGPAPSRGRQRCDGRHLGPSLWFGGGVPPRNKEERGYRCSLRRRAQRGSPCERCARVAVINLRFLWELWHENRPAVVLLFGFVFFVVGIIGGLEQFKLYVLALGAFLLTVGAVYKGLWLRGRRKASAKASRYAAKNEPSLEQDFEPPARLGRAC